MAKLLTEEEQLVLRNKAKAELERLETELSDLETKKMIDNYKEKFSLCEIVYKIIFEEHQFKKTGEHPQRMQIKMTQVPHALKFAGYTYDKNLLTNLFGGEDRVGKRTVKKLRDALTHSMSKSSVEELRSREQELHGYMDEFLNVIKNFDNQAA